MKWRWGTTAADRWIIIYSGKDDVNPMHFTWGHHQEDWCEHVFQWLRKVRLSQELEKVRNEINLVNVIKCLDELNNRVAERLEKVQNMTIFTTQWKDPATYANYPSRGLICPDARFSVQYVGLPPWQPVRMGVKPSRSPWADTSPPRSSLNYALYSSPWLTPHHMQRLNHWIRRLPTRQGNSAASTMVSSSRSLTVTSRSNAAQDGLGRV
eukprot:483014-Amphidinium_carterae.1